MTSTGRGHGKISNANFNVGRKRSFLETLEGLPTVIVLAVIFSAIATTGIWSFSSSYVLASLDPTMPFVLSAIGYGGLGAIALVIALKLIRGVERRQNTDL